jgi:hypothetical protein
MANGKSNGAAYKRIAEDILALAAGLGAGAGLMFLCDPQRGRARRSRLAGELSGLIRRDESRVAKHAKDMLHRVGGLAAEAMSAIAREAEGVADEVLVERVNSRLGHVIPHPHDVAVYAKDGVVTLEGKLARPERRRLREEVGAIPGVKRVNDCLTTRSAFAPGLLIGLAAGLAMLGKTGASRAEAAGPQDG